MKDILTAADGDGQQCIAAPAWTASIEPEVKGSLEMSALTNTSLLQVNNRIKTNTTKLRMFLTKKLQPISSKTMLSRQSDAYKNIL